MPLLQRCSLRDGFLQKLRNNPFWNRKNDSGQAKKDEKIYYFHQKTFKNPCLKKNSDWKKENRVNILSFFYTTPCF
jgi:hypothetical protein